MVSSFKAFLRALWDGQRSALLLKPRPDAFNVTLGVGVAICAINMLVGVAYEYAMSRGSIWYFDASGVTFGIAYFGLLLAFLALLPFARTGAAPARIFVGVVATGTLIFAMATPLTAIDMPVEVFAGVAVGLLVWCLVATARLGHGLAERCRWRAGLGTLAIVLLSIFTLPQVSILSRIDAGRSNVSLLESAAAFLRSAPASHNAPAPPRLDVEAILHRQPELLRKRLAELQTPPTDRPELYFIGMAPFSMQDVFKREVASVKGLFDVRFNTAGRSLVLQNHRETVSDTPLATMSNLDDALAHIGGLMRRDKDVLVLFVTSHGSPGLLSVAFPRFPLNEMTPERLAGALDRSGIQNRVLVISACHSGSFIPALQTDTTLIITAASADRTSFGCSNENEWTYFGDAYFNHALKQETSFIDAFTVAKDLISAWEKRDGLTPSEPQIFIGAEIKAKLDLVALAPSRGLMKKAETDTRELLR